MKLRLLSREETLFLVIDPQARLMPHIFESGRVTANIILLIRLARVAGLPLIVTTQYEKGLGPIVPEIAEEVNGGRPLDKVEFSCFNNSEFVEHLEQVEGGKRVLVVSGVESHICVAQTALGALARGYEVHAASDAISSRTERNWRIGLDRMGQAGAVMSSTEMIIYELLGRSDTPEFKAMLPHLRSPVV